MRVYHEKKSNGLRGDHEKKSNRLRVYHEKDNGVRVHHKKEPWGKTSP